MSETVKRPTLCWTCTRPGTGGCSWDKELKPVEGWKAERNDLWTTGKNRYTESYIVEECPLYERDNYEKLFIRNRKAILLGRANSL